MSKTDLAGGGVQEKNPWLYHRTPKTHVYNVYTSLQEEPAELIHLKATFFRPVEGLLQSFNFTMSKKETQQRLIQIKKEKVDNMEKQPMISAPSDSASTSTGEEGGTVVSEETLAIFEKRILELAKEFPKGIPDKILQNDMPALKGTERAMAINKLLSDGVLDLYKQGSELLYKVKSDASVASESTPDQMRDADKEDRVVFEIIKEAGNMGIWIRDIRVRSNLNLPQLNKIVRSLENKKLIKAVKSVAASKKKVYMMYGLEPHTSLTGGAWYSDQDFESEFVTILNQQCYKYLWERRQQGLAQPDDLGPKAKMAIALTTLEDLWKYIGQLGISKVALSQEDIASILNTLIYDGKVEKVHKGDLEYYLAAESLVDTTGLVQVPCGVCPVFKNCTERGTVNPSSCIYLNNWLLNDF